MSCWAPGNLVLHWYQVKWEQNYIVSRIQWCLHIQWYCLQRIERMPRKTLLEQARQEMKESVWGVGSELGRNLGKGLWHMLSLKWGIFGFLLFRRLALGQAERTWLKNKKGTTSKIGHYGGRVGAEPGHQEELVQSINNIEREDRYDHHLEEESKLGPLGIHGEGSSRWAGTGSPGIQGEWNRTQGSL